MVSASVIRKDPTVTKKLDGYITSPTEVVSNAVPRPNALRSTEKIRQRPRRTINHNNRNNDASMRREIQINGNVMSAADFDTYYGVHQTGKGLMTDRLQRYLREQSANERHSEDPPGATSRNSEERAPKFDNNINVACLRPEENNCNQASPSRPRSKSSLCYRPATLESTRNNDDHNISTRLQSELPPINKTMNNAKKQKSKKVLPPKGQRRKSVGTKSTEKKIDNVTQPELETDRRHSTSPSKANCRTPFSLSEGRILSCVRGGKVVGARVAECILVTAEAYEHEFGSKRKKGPRNASTCFDEQCTMSTVGSSVSLFASSENGKTAQDSGFKENDKSRIVTECIVPDSSLSGSSSSGSSESEIKSNNRLPPRFDTSIAKQSSCSSQSSIESVRRPPRVLNISKVEETEDSVQEESINCPQHTENHICQRNGLKSDAYRHAPISLDQYKLRDNPPLASNADPLSSIRDVYSHRRPRGFHSNLTGEAGPYDELSGQRESPIGTSQPEFQDLRRLRLEMFLQGNNANQNNKALSTDSGHQSDALIANNVSLGNTQQVCAVKDPSGKQQTDKGDNLYESALRDLEAQDKIIQNLLKEYDNTKRILSETQKELESTKSTAGKHIPIMSSLDYDPKVKHWQEAEDKLISEIQENQNLLKKFVDLKEQTKSIKQWLSQPKGTENGIPRTVLHSTTHNDDTVQNDMNAIEPALSDTTSGEDIDTRQSQILSLRAQLLEAQSSRLVTLEKLVKLNLEHNESHIDTKFFQRRLDKLKRDREESNTDKSTTSSVENDASSAEKEVYRLREEVSKLTKDLRISNSLCTDHRRKVSNLERELVTVSDEGRKVRSQVEKLLLELHSTKRVYDDKNQSNLTEARVFQDEIRRIKQTLSS